MEALLFKSLVDILTDDSLPAKLLNVLSILNEQRILMYMMKDAETEGSQTRNSSRSLVKKWNTTILDILRTGDASTRYCAITLLRETIRYKRQHFVHPHLPSRVSNYEIMLANFNLWQDTLVALSKKVRITSLRGFRIFTSLFYLYPSPPSPLHFIAFNLVHHIVLTQIPGKIHGSLFRLDLDDWSLFTQSPNLD